MKRHYVPDKRCLFAIECNKGSNEVMKENNVDEVLVTAPANTHRDETAA